MSIPAGRYGSPVTSTPQTPGRPRRVRLSREERLAQIIEASTRLVSRQGFWGLSLQEVATEVGITQAGLLHYVHTKEGLLQLLIEQGYDRRFDPEDFIATGDAAATHPDGASFPAYCRYLVANNARDPQLIRLYMVLGAESMSRSTRHTPTSTPGRTRCGSSTPRPGGGSRRRSAAGRRCASWSS